MNTAIHNNVTDPRETEVRRFVRNKCKKLGVHEQTVRSVLDEALETLRAGSSVHCVMRRMDAFLRLSGYSDRHPNGAA